MTITEIQKIADKYNMIVKDNHQGSFQAYHRSEDKQSLEEVDRSDLPMELDDILIKIENDWKIF